MMVFLIIDVRKGRIMNVFWSIKGWILLVFTLVFQLNLTFCSLNDEGIALLKFKESVVNDPFGALSNWGAKVGENNPCPWFGIQCVDGHVVSLNLQNLCLEGTLAPELLQLPHIKSILLRSNSFSGVIPRDITALSELELLDLSYNNIRRPQPNEFKFNLTVLLLDHNGLSCHVSLNPEKIETLSEASVDKVHLTRSEELLPTTGHIGKQKDAEHVRMLVAQDVVKKRFIGLADPNDVHHATKAGKVKPLVQPASPSPSPPPLTAPTAGSVIESKPGKNPSHHSPSNPVPPSPETSPPVSPPHQSGNKTIFIVVGTVGGFIVLLLAIGLCFWSGITIRKNGSWPKGLSGQLQKAFVSGLQNLKRSELESACEDFSNVIGTCSIGTIYKGTLSNGVEIAVIALAATSAKDWPKSLETQFRKKIETLSKVSHKNFVSLIGYCEEAQPFTRMMVFEYAPNGSLFEHLHVREAEHLDWGMRLRVAMGMAYCLEHMHQLEPPVTHPNLNSSAVFLSEDYAAKISDFCFWNEVAAAQVQPVSVTNLCASAATPESNVYSFGLVLLEMVTGRVFHTLENSNSVEDWVSEYMDGGSSLQELVDPMLRRYSHEQLDKISELIRKCLHSDPKLRPTMKDITTRLKEITTIDRDKAGPRLSPLWWAELEGRSMNGGE